VAAEFNNPGDGSLIVRFEYQTDLSNLSATLRDAANYLYLAHGDEFAVYDTQTGGIIPFDQLSNDQALGILDTYLKRQIRHLALQHRAEMAASQAFSDPSATLD